LEDNLRIISGTWCARKNLKTDSESASKLIKTHGILCAITHSICLNFTRKCMNGDFYNENAHTNKIARPMTKQEWILKRETQDKKIKSRHILSTNSWSNCDIAHKWATLACNNVMHQLT
jgi:hypothetical protein